MSTVGTSIPSVRQRAFDISDAGCVLVGDAASQFHRRWKLRLGPKTWTDPPILFGDIISIPIVGDWDADGRSQVGLMEFLGRDTGRVEFRLDVQGGWLPRLEVPFGRTGDVPVVLSGSSAKR